MSKQQTIKPDPRELQKMTEQQRKEYLVGWNKVKPEKRKTA